MLANFQICISLPLMIEGLLNKSYLENKTTRLVLISKSVYKLFRFYVETGTRIGFTSQFSACIGALTRKSDDYPERLN